MARHFVEYLYAQDISVEICGIDVKSPDYDILMYEPKIKILFREIDMTKEDMLRALFDEFVPDYVLHLAAYSSVAYSWKHPADSFLNNGNIFLNLIECIKEVNLDCRILSVGSSEEYGNVNSDDVPIKETHLLNPISPYAVARISQEYLSKIFVDAYGMNIVLTRSFNHIGPRQDDRFVVPSFIKRIIQIKDNGNDEGTIEAGDLSIIRDFVDVRDVVKAYYLLLLSGKSGEIYNVCSGTGIRLSDLVLKIAQLTGVSVTTVVNSDYVRPNDNKVMVGDNRKIMKELGWKPEIAIDQTLSDMIGSRTLYEDY